MNYYTNELNLKDPLQYVQAGREKLDLNIKR